MFASVIRVRSPRFSLSFCPYFSAGLPRFVSELDGQLGGEELVGLQKRTVLVGVAVLELGLDRFARAKGVRRESTTWEEGAPGSDRVR